MSEAAVTKKIIVAHVKMRAGRRNEVGPSLLAAAKTRSIDIKMSIAAAASNAEPVLAKKPFTIAKAEITPAIPRAYFTAGTPSIAARNKRAGMPNSRGEVAIIHVHHFGKRLRTTLESLLVLFLQTYSNQTG